VERREERKGLHKLHDNEFKSNNVCANDGIMWAQTDFSRAESRATQQAKLKGNSGAQIKARKDAIVKCLEGVLES